MTRMFDPDTLLKQSGWLKGLARGLVLDESRADDVVQQTWLAALERPPREPKALPAWLARVARNEARQAWRSESARGRRERRVARPEAGVDPVDEVVAKAELSREIVRRVLELETGQRDALLLRYFEGLEPAEIAARLDVPAATVRSRVKRGLDRLREDLDRECDGDRRAWVAALVPCFGLDDLRAPAATAAGGAAVGAAASGAKLKALLVVGLLLLAGGLVLWAVSSPAPEEPTTVGRGGEEETGPTLRGTAEPDEETAVKEVPAQAPPPAATPSAPALAVVFVDETGRRLAPEEAKARYAAAGLPPAVTFVADEVLMQGGLQGLLAALLGDPGTWQHEVGLTWSADGARVEAPGPGAWRIFAGRPGAAPLLSDRIDLAEGDPVRFEMPLPSAPKRVPLELVDAASGNPLAGATITPFHEYGDDQAFFRGPSLTADAGGRVDVPVLEEAVRGRWRGATWWVQAGDTHAVSLSNWELDRLDTAQPNVVRVPRTATVEGTAWRSTGASAAGCEVVWARKGLVRRAVVGEDGRFRLAGIGLKGGDERALAQTAPLLLVEDLASGTVSSARADVSPGAVAQVEIGRPAAAEDASIEGRVTAGGHPLAGVFVTARDASRENKMAQTDADGGYLLAGLKAGPVEVSLYLGDPRVVDDFSIRSQAPVTLQAGGTRRLDLDLPGGVVRVTVVDATTGKPVPGGVAFARPAEKGLEAQRFEGFHATLGWGGRTGEDGTILLYGLVPGHPHDVAGAGENYTNTEQGGVLPGTWEDPAAITIRVSPRSR